MVQARNGMSSQAVVIHPSDFVSSFGVLDNRKVALMEMWVRMRCSTLRFHIWSRRAFRELGPQLGNASCHHVTMGAID